MIPNYNITPGQDKFLRIHIDDLSRPIRPSAYHRPPSRDMPSDCARKLANRMLALFGVTAMLVTAYYLITAK